VDDSPSMRALVEATLVDAGFEVASAASGTDALDLAKQRPFRLVLADVNMPGMDGIQLVRELRTIPKHKFTPILILTTEIGAERKSEAKAAGATGWLVKPFEPSKLVATVRRVVA